ncbi:hypothetical protein FACS1894198_3230 [Clostridia bacterium]|nr:hypothetical protein FACS1894198_3230 [Clostridia bacterium]
MSKEKKYDIMFGGVGIASSGLVNFLFERRLMFMMYKVILLLKLILVLLEIFYYINK